MRLVRISVCGVGLAFCLMMSMATPQGAWASGRLLTIEEEYCYKFALQKVILSPTPSTYLFTGTCDLAHTRLLLPVKVTYTTVGRYDPTNGNTTEEISVPPPAINEPSRPYGRFFASMRCAADPWRDRNVKCDQVVASVNPPASAYPPNQSGDLSRSLIRQIFDQITKYSLRPYTSSLTSDQKKVVDAQYDAALASERRSQQLQQGAKKTEGTSYSAGLSPSVLSPASGQTVVAQTPVLIKLSPPKGWNVTGYMVNIQRKDAKGIWVHHTTIPVSAAEAQSPTGYMGFGNGAPPAFLIFPGAWRLNAQASSPKQSGTSDWIQFYATAYQGPVQQAAPKNGAHLQFKIP